MPRSTGTGFVALLWQALTSRFRMLVFGNPLATSVSLEHRLPIVFALAVFASDALSSVAYGTEEILRQLAPHSLPSDGSAAHVFLIPITMAIVLLMVIVAVSYYQAIHLYPSGGGSYSVSRDNLGVFPGLAAAAALTIDYILTVAVSVSAGVFALTSLFPVLLVFKVWIAVALVLLVTLINLRGTRESGWIFAFPAYSFIAMIILVIMASLYHKVTGSIVPLSFDALDPRYALPHDALRPDPASPIGLTSMFGLLIIARAFSSGCSAMTGVEAVSNGISAFQPPEAKNAAKTLLILISILIIMFFFVGLGAHWYGAIPTSSETESVISQLTRANFGRGGLWFITQLVTALILMVAANTSFAGFPRLLAIVAKDGYAPKTFTSLGDRLVHNRGILVLTVISILLIIGFKAEVNKLIPLYAVGVFLCFTLSQLGMVRKAQKTRDKGWQRTVIINFAGAIITGIVTLVQAVSKFGEGAWVVVVLLPIIIMFSYLVHRHYVWFEKTMTVHPNDFNPLADTPEPLTVLVLVSSDIHRGILEGLECGRAIADGKPNSVLRAVHIEMDPEKTPRLKTKWAQLVEPYLGHQIRLDIVPSPYRWLIEPVMEYLDQADMERGGDRVILVLPEFETGSVVTHFLHNFTARRLRTALLNRPHVTVVSSRFFMRPMAWRLGRGGLVY